MGGFFAYLEGVHNALAETHVPEVAPRNDTRAGPEGRRGDQVGCWRQPAGRASSGEQAVQQGQAVCGCGGSSSGCAEWPSGSRNLLFLLSFFPSSACAVQVGGFNMLAREDLRKVAPRWLEYTERVRADPLVRVVLSLLTCCCVGSAHGLHCSFCHRCCTSQHHVVDPLAQAWNLTGDTWVKEGEAPWIR